MIDAARRIDVTTRSTETSEMILEVLAARPGIELAILFGSLATGTHGADSDIDLAIDAGAPLTAEEKAALITTLAARTGRPVDLIDLQTAGEPLLGEILAGGKRLLGTDEKYADLLRRHLFDAADFLPYRNRILEDRRRAWIGT